MVKIYYIYGESDYYIYGWKIITFMVSHLYLLFTGREDRIGKNCPGLEHGPRPTASGRA